MRRSDVDSTTHPASNFTRRHFLQMGGMAVGGSLALYSCEYARHALQHVSIPIAIRNLPSNFHGFRIVQISDIHFEGFTEPFYLERIIREVNHLAADLVLITGDFISHGPPRATPEKAIYVVAEMLKGLTCPQRLGCMGNHDSAVGAEFVASILRDRGTPILINQYVPIERNGERIWVGGVADPSTSQPNLAQAMPAEPDAPVILMSHAPDYADNVLRHPYGANVDLILSGHSHGGQIRLPFVGPLVLPPMGKKYIEGHFRFGALQLYVNRGVGAVGVPFRFNCPPEITTITLQPA